LETLSGKAKVNNLFASLSGQRCLAAQKETKFALLEKSLLYAGRNDAIRSNIYGVCTGKSTG